MGRIMTGKAETVRCDNAGLVLLHSYFPSLFARLDLLEGQHFTTPEAAARAIAALHRLATGLDQAANAASLPLCKLLTGIPLETQVPDAELNDEQHRLCDSLVEAAIAHWPAIGQQSLDGFRGNFLRRDGMLVRGEDRWNLRVEKRSYDVLIAHAPFSYALIRHPWMPQPIHVDWPM
jgi:hypothetical protein